MIKLPRRNSKDRIQIEQDILVTGQSTCKIKNSKLIHVPADKVKSEVDKGSELIIITQEILNKEYLINA